MFLHDVNILSPNFLTFSGKTTDNKLLHSENASSEIQVTVFGMVILSIKYGTITNFYTSLLYTIPLILVYLGLLLSTLILDKL